MVTDSERWRKMDYKKYNFIKIKWGFMENSDVSTHETEEETKIMHVKSTVNSRFPPFHFWTCPDFTLIPIIF